METVGRELETVGREGGELETVGREGGESWRLSVEKVERVGDCW